MCGRFTTTFEFSDLRIRWNLDRDLPKYTPRFNIAPETSPNIPLIIRHGGVNECQGLRNVRLQNLPAVMAKFQTHAEY